MPPGRHRHRHQHGVMTGWIVRPYDLVVGGWLMRASYRRIAAGVTAGIAPHHRVLDIGTGPGRLVEAIAYRRPDLTVIGVDPSVDMIARASRRTAQLSNVETTIAAAEALPLENDSVAAVVSTLSSHHWADAEAALAEQVRVLAPGGRFWLVDLISHLPDSIENQVEAAGLWPTDDEPDLTGITGRRLRVITARKPLAAA